MPTTGATTRDTHFRLATMSGARLDPIPTDAARSFLARLREPVPVIEFALGAFQHDDTMIGVAALCPHATGQAPVVVAVVPERRRLKVGSDLFHAVAAEAACRDVHHLVLTYPAGRVAADGLVHSSEPITDRRVANGVVTAILHIPDRR